MPNLPKDQELMGLNHMLVRAKEVADQHGSAPLECDFGPTSVEARIRALGNHTVMWERDRSHRDAVRDLMIPLLMEAVLEDYNVANQEVFRACSVSRWRCTLLNTPPCASWGRLRKQWSSTSRMAKRPETKVSLYGVSCEQAYLSSTHFLTVRSSGRQTRRPSFLRFW